jgi:hypothetical protein
MCAGFVIPNRGPLTILIQSIIRNRWPLDSVETRMASRAIRDNPESRETAWAGRRLPSLSNHHAICHLAIGLFHKSLSKPTDRFLGSQGDS